MTETATSYSRAEWAAAALELGWNTSRKHSIKDFITLITESGKSGAGKGLSPDTREILKSLGFSVKGGNYVGDPPMGIYHKTGKEPPCFSRLFDETQQECIECLERPACKAITQRKMRLATEDEVRDRRRQQAKKESSTIMGKKSDTKSKKKAQDEEIEDEDLETTEDELEDDEVSEPMPSKKSKKDKGGKKSKAKDEDEDDEEELDELDEEAEEEDEDEAPAKKSKSKDKGKDKKADKKKSKAKDDEDEESEDDEDEEDEEEEAPKSKKSKDKKAKDEPKAKSKKKAKDDDDDDVEVEDEDEPKSKKSGKGGGDADQRNKNLEKARAARAANKQDDGPEQPDLADFLESIKVPKRVTFTESAQDGVRRLKVDGKPAGKLEHRGGKYRLRFAHELKCHEAVEKASGLGVTHTGKGRYAEGPADKIALAITAIGKNAADRS